MGAIVLAAGASSRMGRTKALLPLGSGTVLSRVVERVLEAPVDRVVVVLGHDAVRVSEESCLPNDPRLRIVTHSEWARGMASSLRVGIEACPDCDGALVVLGDQPGIDPGLVARLVEAWRKGATLALPVREGRAGHPVLFDRRLFAELLHLDGDAGAREVVKAHWAAAVQVDAPALRDLDTPEDYEAFLADHAPSTPEGFEIP